MQETDKPVVHTEDAAPHRSLGEMPAPISLYEIAGATLRPHRVIEYVLGNHDRLMRNVMERRYLPHLVLLLLGGSVLLAVPYGAALAPADPVRHLHELAAAAFWKMPVLFTGSVLLCFPSLFVFGQYLGFRLELGQTLALALVVSATAAMFSLGFFPVVWFVRVTTTPGSSDVAVLSFFLLAGALFLGFVQLARCLLLASETRRYSGLFGVWGCLLFFIAWRMADVLGVGR